MENVHQTLSQPGFNPVPILDMYLTSLDAWKKNYDALVQAPRVQQGQPGGALNPGAAYENTSAQWQKNDFFRRFVEQQIKICRFFGKRWEQYLDLPSDLSRCQSPADFAQVQLAFLTKMAADYGTECRHLTQALLSNWMTVQSAPVIPKQPTLH